MNRQRYMAELSKLLAFMFKEDKEDILAQYNKMLDEAEDEQAMLESFGSPTKLAVTISRTYKRSERKLAVTEDSKQDAPANTESEHIIVRPVRKENKETAPAPVQDTSLSYADIVEEIRREKAAEQGVEYTPIFFNELDPQPEPEPESEETPVEEASAAEPAPAEAPQAVEVPSEEAEDNEAPEEEAPEVRPAEEENSEEAPAEAEREPEVKETAAESPEQDNMPEEMTVVETAAPEEPEGETVSAEEAPAEEEDEEAEAVIVLEEPEEIQPVDEQVRYKTNAALLILYLIVAIPVGVVLFAAALAIGIVLLASGAGLIALCVKVIGFAFSMFAIFADVMLCAGASLAAFAVALMLIWLGILMFARGLGGLIRGIVALGRKFCVREVTVNE